MAAQNPSMDSRLRLKNFLTRVISQVMLSQLPKLEMDKAKEVFPQELEEMLPHDRLGELWSAIQFIVHLIIIDTSF